MRFKKLIMILSVPGFITLAGCEKIKDFGDTNVDPSVTTRPILSALLTNAEATVGGYASNTTGGLYAQHISETQYTDVSLYSLPQFDFAGEYAGVLYDLQNIINTNESNNMTQVARILQQYVFWSITDRWGDIPYSEALKGAAIVRPKYDTQEEVYKGMIATLTSAVASFDNSPINGDIIYNGNVARWKRAANSMRLLMALRLSKVYPGANDYAATQFKAALADAGGVIASTADNMVVDYPGGAAYRHPWYARYDGRKDFAESKTMTDILGSFSDPRANVYGGATEDNSSALWNQPSTVGFPYGLKRSSAEGFSQNNPTWARVFRGDYREQGDALVVIGAAEVFLARAEAADRGWTNEDMSAMYQAGITASFEQWGLPAPAAGYFTQPGVALTAAPGTAGNLQQIATQRWIALYTNGLHAWSEWRRTGYPVLTPAPDAVNTSKQIPRRYTYGTGEYGSNPENVKAAAARIQGGDTQDSRVWWDKP